MARFLNLIALVFGFCLTLVAQQASAAEVFGRYLGTLHHQALDRDQLVKLDFVTSRDQNDQLKIGALLTVYLGDFQSSEYVTFSYTDVKYDAVTGRMSFSHPDQDLSFVTTLKFDGVLVADVSSATMGSLGRLTLRNDVDSITPERDLIAPLWGEYRGTCDGRDQLLQLYTYRSTREVGRTSHALISIDVRGAEGYLDRLCNPNLDAPMKHRCLMNRLTAGTYDFFKGTVTLDGDKPRSCVVTATGLACDGCDYRRVSSEGQTTSANAPKTFPTSKPDAFGEPGPSNTNGDLTGTYFGYVHHEYLNQYQSASLSLQATPASDGRLNLSAVARLYFGDHRSSEVLAYNFADASFPVVMAKGHVLFARPELGIDAMVTITSMSPEKISGVWHSSRFGRVGSFVMTKNAPPKLGDGAVVMKSLAGDYTWDRYTLKTQVRTSAASLLTENPFFPLEFNGNLSFNGGGGFPNARVMNIAGGSYDFYTGRVALLGGDGQMVSSVIGNIRENGSQWDLRVGTHTLFTRMQSHDRSPFERKAGPSF